MRVTNNKDSWPVSHECESRTFHVRTPHESESHMIKLFIINSSNATCKWLTNLIERNPPGGASLLAGFQTKSPEEEHPPRRATPKIDHGGFFRSNCQRVTCECESLHMVMSSWLCKFAGDEFVTMSMRVTTYRNSPTINSALMQS